MLFRFLHGMVAVAQAVLICSVANRAISVVALLRDI